MYFISDLVISHVLSVKTLRDRRNSGFLRVIIAVALRAAV
jgi:hypothetical protein